MVTGCARDLGVTGHYVVVAEVVEPQSRYFCPCDCHRVGGVQLDLFGNTLVHTGFEVQK